MYNTLNYVIFKQFILKLWPLLTQGSNPLSIWLPDIHFLDGTDVSIIVDYLKLRPGGKLTWSRHIKISVSEALFGIVAYFVTFHILRRH